MTRARTAAVVAALSVLGACSAPTQPGRRTPAATTSPPGDPAPTTTPSPASTTSPATISADDVDAHLAGVDELERTQPLTRHLPHDNAHFRVDYRVDDSGALELIIELRAILNRPDQLAAYEAQLRAYRDEALDWLRSVGGDPTALAITYRPPEAAAL